MDLCAYRVGSDQNAKCTVLSGPFLSIHGTQYFISWHGLFLLCFSQVDRSLYSVVHSLFLKAQITAAADNIFIFFFIFQRKLGLTFHVNCLHSRQFTWNVKPYFLWKKKSKNVVSDSFAWALRLFVKANINIFTDEQVKKMNLMPYANSAPVRSVQSILCSFIYSTESIDAVNGY